MRNEEYNMINFVNFCLNCSIIIYSGIGAGGRKGCWHLIVIVEENRRKLDFPFAKIYNYWDVTIYNEVIKSIQCIHYFFDSFKYN